MQDASGVAAESDRLCVADSHVLCDGGIADSVCSRGDAGLTTVAAAAAIQTRHVNAVQVIVSLLVAVSHGLLLSILLIPSGPRKQQGETQPARGALLPTRKYHIMHRPKLTHPGTGQRRCQVICVYYSSFNFTVRESKWRITCIYTSCQNSGKLLHLKARSEA